jgi:hypothetical protein
MEGMPENPSNIRHAAYYYTNRDKILEKNRIKREQKKKMLEEMRNDPEFDAKENELKEAKRKEKEQVLEQKRKEIELQHLLTVEFNNLLTDLSREEAKLISIEKSYDAAKQNIIKLKDSIASITKLRNERGFPTTIV